MQTSVTIWGVIEKIANKMANCSPLSNLLYLEEQNIPKPQLWEWLWFGGSLVTFVIGANAIKTSRTGKIQIFGAIVLLLGVLPILWGK